MSGIEIAQCLVRVYAGKNRNLRAFELLVLTTTKPENKKDRGSSSTSRGAKWVFQLPGLPIVSNPHPA